MTLLGKGGMMDKENAETLFIPCDCGDYCHSIVLTYFPWEKDDWPFVFLSVHMNQTPFFKRLWKAVKYAWGGERLDMGHWHEVLLNQDSMIDIGKFLKRFEVQ